MSAFFLFLVRDLEIKGLFDSKLKGYTNTNIVRVAFLN